MPPETLCEEAGTSLLPRPTSRQNYTGSGGWAGERAGAVFGERSSALSNLAGRKISLILHKFSRGGSDRVAAYLARGFASAGMDVELVVFCSGGEVEDILSRLVGDDIPIRYLGRPSASRPLDLIRGLPALVRHLRRAQPDFILSTANNTALATVVATWRAGLRDARVLLKTTNPIASSRHRGLARGIRRSSYRLIFRRTAAVLTLSADESAEMREAFPRFADIFHDVANPYVTPTMLAPATPRTGPPTIISIARLTAQKRLDRLIEAFAHVRHPAARLLILGEGEDRAALEAQTARLGLSDRVAMPGYVTDVASALAGADLFVLPSDYEGLPAVVLEAMAAQCPVLCTDCFPAARSLLADAPGCAIITDPSPIALAAQIDAHLAAPKPDGLAAIAERYSISAGVAGHVAALLAVAG